MEQLSIKTAEISPLLNIVAEFIIESNIALKKYQLYKAKHKTAQASIERVLKKLKDFFSLSPQLKLYFIRNTIIFEQNYLDKNNPIFNQFISHFSSLRILGLEIKKGVEKGEIEDLFNFLNKYKQPKYKKELEKIENHENFSPNIKLEILKVSEVHIIKKDEVSPIDKETSEKLWEEFLFHLSGGAEDKIQSNVVSKSVIDLAKNISQEARERGKDYSTAVVDYLKKIDINYRQKGILSKSEFGKKIKTLIEEMDAPLRQQIIASCLTDEKISSNILQELLEISEHKYVLDALEKLNSESRAIPLTVYRTLTMLSMLEGDEYQREEIGDPLLPEMDKSDFQALLDTLLAEDQRFEYSTPEYEEKIEKFQEYAGKMAKLKGKNFAKTTFSQAVTETHFLGISWEILEKFPKDLNIAEYIANRLNNIFKYFLKTKQLGGILKTIAMKNKLCLKDPKISALPFVWEEEENIKYLVDVLTGEDKSEALIGGKVLSLIGLKAVPHLLNILETSKKIEDRMNCLKALINMEENPSKILLDQLEKNPPWYLARNIVYIFKKRKEPMGAEVFKKIWGKVHPKVKIEIIYYLYLTRKKEWIEFFKDALSSSNEELVISAARLIVKIRWDEAVEAVMERVKAIPPWKIGDTFQKKLIEYLIKSGSIKAIGFVVNLPKTTKTLFPWQKISLQKYIKELLKENKIQYGY